MIFAIMFLFVAVVILGAVVGELRATVIKIEIDVSELTYAHNWNMKELEHRAEQKQVVKVVEL